MKSLIISAVSLLLIICIWFCFMTYCENSLGRLLETLSEDVIAKVVSDDWTSASESFERFSKKWHEQKTIYSLFLEQSAMIDADFSIAKAEGLILTKDKSGSLSELYTIHEQLHFLFLNERLTFENIL